MTPPDHHPVLPGIRTAREILEEAATSSRTNFGNDGREFQKEIEVTCGAYQMRRVATIRKVDPPVRVLGGGLRRKVIFLANPWLDFAGCWKVAGGRGLFFEVKSTSVPRLGFNCDKGLTASQFGAIKIWRDAGACAFLLWRYGGAVRLWTPAMLEDAAARGDKSLRHENGRGVPRGEGSVIWDFLATVTLVEAVEKGCRIPAGNA